MSQENYVWPVGDIDVWWWVSESGNQVTEQDIQRVQTQSGQAQQVAQQIQKDRIHRGKMADFLTFLVQDLSNEKIVHWIYEVFFKVKNHTDNTVFIRKSINTIVVVWIFAPFYHEAIQKYWLRADFEKIQHFDTKLSLSSYVHYLKDLSVKYHDNIAIEKHTFLHFIEEVVLEFNLVDKDKLTKEKYPQFQKTLEKEIYW